MQSRSFSSRFFGPALFAALITLAAPAVMASPTPSFKISIRHQAFKPDTLNIPAGKQVKILVKNEDAMPAEFESYDFNREKVVPGHSRVAVYVGPLKAGKYSFFNDFHHSSKGTLIVR